MKVSERYVYKCDACGKEVVASDSKPVLMNVLFSFPNRSFSKEIDICADCYPNSGGETGKIARVFVRAFGGDK